MKHTGFIRLHRAILDNPLYETEPFTKTMAWIDLLLNAKYEDEKEWHRGSEILVKRGQLVVSLGELSKKWKWTRSKVQRFLDYLEREKAIQKPIQSAIQKPIQLSTIISIVNYDKYQTPDTKCDAKCDTHIKEYNNIINKNSPSLLRESPLLTDRQKKFYDSLVPFIGQYGKEMLREFYDYWSETDRSSKPRMRFEKEKTWCLDRRLERWRRNNEEFKRPRATQQQKPSKLDQYKAQAQRLGLLDYDTDQSNSIDEQ